MYLLRGTQSHMSMFPHWNTTSIRTVGVSVCHYESAWCRVWFRGYHMILSVALLTLYQPITLFGVTEGGAVFPV